MKIRVYNGIGKGTTFFIAYTSALIGIKLAPNGTKPTALRFVFVNLFP